MSGKNVTGELVFVVEVPTFTLVWLGDHNISTPLGADKTKMNEVVVIL
jgi:hypothetical protein